MAVFESILQGLLFHFKVKAIKLTVPCNKLINKNRLTKWYEALPSSTSYPSPLVHRCFSLGRRWKVLFKFKLRKVLGKIFQTLRNVGSGSERKMDFFFSSGAFQYVGLCIVLWSWLPAQHRQWVGSHQSCGSNQKWFP